jgi:hypothetical protein
MEASHIVIELRDTEPYPYKIDANFMQLLFEQISNLYVLILNSFIASRL